MKNLPVFLNMENKKVLIVGGGNAALIKIKKLIDFDCDVTVISNNFLIDILEFKNIKIIKKDFEEKDIEGFFLVVAAAENSVNKFVYECAKNKGILCSVSGGDIKGDFIFPAHKKNDRLTVALSTDGAYPALAKKLCSKIDVSLGDRINFFEEKRKFVIKNVSDKNLKKKILSEIIDDDVIYSENYIEKTENILKRYFMSDILKIGTRGSLLALKQAEIVEKMLKKKFENIETEIVVIKTQGDKILDKTIDKIGGKGVFVKEIEQALIDKKIDIAVHSLKDMPEEMPKGLKLGAVTSRENPHDVFVSGDGTSFFDMPSGSKIGTGSLRRSVQLKNLRDDIEIVPIRGNINTRLSKIGKEVDGVILAAAGLNRAGLSNMISYEFSADEMVPAACQGIIGIEIRDNDDVVEKYVSAINDKTSEICQKAERGFLKVVGADCHAPVGAFCTVFEDNIKIKGVYYTDKIVFDDIEGKINEAEILGKKLAEKIIAK